MSQTESTDAAYADGTPLVELFGDTARSRLLSVFATKPSREFTVSELAEQAGVTRKTVYQHLEDLEERGVMVGVDGGRGTRYTANEDSQIHQKLYELNGVTLQDLLDQDQ